MRSLEAACTGDGPCVPEVKSLPASDSRGGRAIQAGVEGEVCFGIDDTVLALDQSTGAEVWQTSLKGSDFVSVVLEGGAVYAGTQGELFCFPATGRIHWQIP